MQTIYHALVLNLHQPPGNLEYLLEHGEWKAKEILWALDRMPRSLWEYEDLARVHLSLSGTLLETLSNSGFQQRVYGIVKCGDLLWQLQNSRIFEILGTGYYHPVLPLIPQDDWEEHLQRWLGIGRHLFGREQFDGFWPPEMGFCMEMIPLIKRLGYRYVLVDSKYVEPIEPMHWQEIRYRPHIAEYDGEEIIVIVRDRELSDAQESGMDYGWFEHELHERTKWCDFPPLVTTCTDGDNGGWFRNTNPKGNFWYVFYKDFMEQIRKDWTVVRPTFIRDYLDQYGAKGAVTVKTGAWNTGWHHGADFLQWTGSQAQKDTLQRLKETSQAFHDIRRALSDPNHIHLIKEAHWHLLRAETSCNFYWGEDWVQRSQEDLDVVWSHLLEVKGAADERRNTRRHSPL
jgi:alpha-amylase/alpha-mannosidase (GH57 family)